mgnify:CR=1 FL=1
MVPDHRAGPFTWNRTEVKRCQAVAACFFLPVIRSVYSAIKQIFETVLAQQSNAFREAVLVEYPRRGIWAIGFITGTTKEEVQNLTEDETVKVRKEGEFVTVRTTESGAGGAEVDVTVPLAVIDGLLSGPDGTLNFQAALEALEIGRAHV